MTRTTVIVTDPGQDQAAAIFAALAAPDEFDVVAVIASAGNIDLDQTVVNCLALLELAGRPDIPVFAGCPRPLARPLVTAEHVHGPTGLDGADLPAPTIAVQSEHGVDALIRILRAADETSVTILSLSPLTTIATAFVQDPSIVTKIERIVAMAGAYFEGGNITPAAEFNVYVDPHAAAIVFDSGAPLVVLPLDVTHKMLSTRERLDGFSATGTACGQAIDGMLTFSESFDLQKYGWHGAPLHGPCVPLYVLHPEMFSGREVSIRVETVSEVAMGTTSVDWWHVTDEPVNAFYVADGDADAFYRVLTDLYARLP
ncbi:nucleoside hydrolase [Herbiconiux daphne]|uniref:Nucleoside hydrolase n=1 Tax=Herbiconiux daphne TaxID=2970914 RepID=A0ABT2H366_9MICO|nr:nucleoside hydrolase [Herbiconiux daphne]MCS5734359.1 nucleoside hydrolase [Herbiconiux daphne]